jgi:hypothetical protein
VCDVCMGHHARTTLRASRLPKHPPGHLKVHPALLRPQLGSKRNITWALWRGGVSQVLRRSEVLGARWVGKCVKYKSMLQPCISTRGTNTLYPTNMLEGRWYGSWYEPSNHGMHVWLPKGVPRGGQKLLFHTTRNLYYYSWGGITTFVQLL